MARPVLIVDEQGWLRLPGGRREQAGVRERVRARATWGKVELHADDPLARPPRPAPRLEPAEKREVELALAGVSKRFAGQEQPVVRDLTWTFEAERLHVLAGPSGSGKTAVLNLLAARDRPRRGPACSGRTSRRRTPTASRGACSSACSRKPCARQERRSWPRATTRISRPRRTIA